MLTVILLDYHSAEDTVAYVQHLCEKIKSDMLLVSFVIVDNSCDAENFHILSQAFSTVENLTWYGSLLEKKEYCGHELYLWKNLQNGGYAKGNNLGAKIADEFIHADYYLFSNSDIVVLDDYLNFDRLIAEFHQMHVGMVGPSIIGKDGKSQNPYKEQSLFLRWGYEYLFYPFARFLPACINSGDLVEPFETNPVFRVMGSFFVIPAKIFNDIGGFDEHTFLFAEELILAKRLQQKDYLVHYVPSVHLLHNHSATINKAFNYNQRLKQRFRSEMYYYRTYCHAKLYVVALITFIFRSFLLKKSVAFWLKNLMIGKKV